MIHHLLTHTSGIWDYCRLDEVRQGIRRDFTVDELIDLFKDKPLDFEPGEKMAYSNSGYVLLGAIIEKVSDQSYAEFLRENIFARAGMDHSTTDEHRKIIRNRAAGYVRGEGGLQNAPFISMTEPFANGDIVSTVNDLYRWNEALFNGLVKRETLELAFTPARLKDGTVTDSACGFGLSQIKGRIAVVHAGHIHGRATPQPYRAGLRDRQRAGHSLLCHAVCDGSVNVFDIDPFVPALANPETYTTTFPACRRSQADCNFDGAVNAFDIDPFVELLVGS